MISGVRPTLGWGKVITGSLLYLVITALVAAILFAGYVFDPGAGILDVNLDPIVYVVALAFLAYQCQEWLSAASGGKRVIDTLVSLTMAVLIAITIAVWFKVPVVAWVLMKVSTFVGYPIASAPSSYNLTVALLFGALAVWDVFFRDLIGIARRSSQATGTSRDSLVTGAHGGLPDATEDLHSRSRAPLYRVTGDGVLDIERWLVRHPFTGELVVVQNVPARALARTIDHLVAPSAATDSGGTPAASSVTGGTPS